MTRIVDDLMTPGETRALAAMIDRPSEAPFCRATPYAAVDPMTGNVQRGLKYLLNQARVRIVEVVERSSGLPRLYPANTVLHLSPGPLSPRGPDEPEWWAEFDGVIPLDATVSLRTGDRDNTVEPGTLVFGAATETWVLSPEREGPWLSVIVTLTDQLDMCEL